MIDLRLNYPLLKQEGSLLQRYLHKINSDELQQRLQLPPWRGFQEDRSIAAQWLSTQGGPIAEDVLSICSSSHHALIILAIAAQLRNTAVVTENFTYPGLKAIATLFGIHLVPCETDESGMLPSSLEKICQQGSIGALYTQPTIQNPLGMVMPLQRRQEIAEIATRYQLLVIEDDAYRFLAKNAPSRFCDLLPQQTAFIMSLAKPFSPALKIAYIIAPFHLATAISIAIRLTSSGASGLLSFVASQMIHEGILDRLIKAKQEEAFTRQSLVKDSLNGFHIQAHVTSYHAWLHLPPGCLSTTIQQRLWKRGVDLVPGEEFAIDEQKGSNYLRVALGGEVERSRLTQGLELLREELFLFL